MLKQREAGMRSPEFGWYDYYSIDERPQSRRITGTELQIAERIDKPGRKRPLKGLDRSLFIISRINEFKADIERYKKLGKVLNRVDPDSKEPLYFDYRKLIPAVEKKIQELYEYL